MTESQIAEQGPARTKFQLDRSLLVRLFGWRAALLHSGLLTLDRWDFVKRFIPKTRNGESVIDIGCGTGAFSFGLAKRGYDVTGLSWDKRNQSVAEERAGICGIRNARFPICDVRELHRFEEFKGRFEYAVCLENIEHIIDDRKLMRDIVECLRPGGWLVLSTPNHNFRQIIAMDGGPFDKDGNGWHVRRGYTPAMLRELADDAGLLVDDIGSHGGFFCQKLGYLASRLGLFGWPIVLPFRVVTLIFDRLVRMLTGYPDLSVTLVAYKPRFA